MDKLTNAPIVIFLLVGVALGGFNYMGNISEMEKLQTNKSNLISQLNEKKDNLEKAKNITSAAPTLKMEIDQLSEKISKVQELMPKKLNSREVIDVILSQAKASGVRLTQTRPVENQQNFAFQNTSQSKKTEAVEVNIEFEGGYSQMTYFFFLLSQSKIYIKSNNVEFKIKNIIDAQANIKTTATLAGLKYLGVQQ